MKKQLFVVLARDESEKPRVFEVPQRGGLPGKFRTVLSLFFSFSRLSLSCQKSEGRPYQTDNLVVAELPSCIF